MDSLFNILSNRMPDEPAEIRIVKGYVRQHFNEEAQVKADERSIVVTVRSSALAGTLRARSSAINREIEKALGKANKRLIFRIGQMPAA